MVYDNRQCSLLIYYRRSKTFKAETYLCSQEIYDIGIRRMYICQILEQKLCNEYVSEKRIFDINVR